MVAENLVCPPPARLSPEARPGAQNSNACARTRAAALVDAGDVADEWPDTRFLFLLQTAAGVNTPRESATPLNFSLRLEAGMGAAGEKPVSGLKNPSGRRSDDSETPGPPRRLPAFSRQPALVLFGGLLWLAPKTRGGPQPASANHTAAPVGHLGRRRYRSGPCLTMAA